MFTLVSVWEIWVVAHFQQKILTKSATTENKSTQKSCILKHLVILSLDLLQNSNLTSKHNNLPCLLQNSYPVCPRSSPLFLQNPSLSRLLPSRQTRRELEIHSATASNLPSRPSAAIPNISRFLPPRFSIARIWRILQPPNPGLPCRVQSPRSPMLERIA